MRPTLVTIAAALLAATAVFGGGTQPRVAAQGTTTVTVGDFFFCDRSQPPESCVTTIGPGDTVVWDYPEGTAGHTVTHCGDSCDDATDSPLWDSGGIKPDESFSFTFESPGTYLYQCDFHPDAMRATIVVAGEEGPAASPTAEPTAEPTATPAATATAPPTPTAVPTAAETPASSPTPPPDAPADAPEDDGDGISAWWFVLAGVGGGLALLAGAYFLRRRPGAGQ